MYTYNNNNEYTIADMFGEYKICRLWRSLENFMDLYPDITDNDLQQLNKLFQAWQQHIAINNQEVT